MSVPQPASTGQFPSHLDEHQVSAQEDGLCHGLVGVEGPSLGVVREVHAEVGPQGLGRGVLELLGQHPQPAIKHPSMHCHKAPVFAPTYTLLQTTGLCTAAKKEVFVLIHTLLQTTGLSTAAKHLSLYACVLSHIHLCFVAACVCALSHTHTHTHTHTQRLPQNTSTPVWSDRLSPSVFKSDSSVFQSTPSASSNCWRTG